MPSRFSVWRNAGSGIARMSGDEILYVVQAVLLAVPFALRLLQAVRKEGAIARQDGRFRAGMVQLGRGEYNGWAGWRRARDELAARAAQRRLCVLEAPARGSRQSIMQGSA